MLALIQRMLVLQALINMAVAVNLSPLPASRSTGQHGGTSTLFTCISVGMILSVNRSVFSLRVWKPRATIDPNMPLKTPSDLRHQYEIA